MLDGEFGLDELELGDELGYVAGKTGCGVPDGLVVVEDFACCYPHGEGVFLSLSHGCMFLCEEIVFWGRCLGVLDGCMGVLGCA